MTVSALIEALQLKALSLCDGSRTINGAYVGDLLSWVMGNAQMDNIWVTIMTNQNIIAVATLIDMSCVVIAEDSEIDDEVVALAKEKGVNLLQSSLPAYELCCEISKLI